DGMSEKCHKQLTRELCSPHRRWTLQGKIPEPTMRAGLIAGFVTIILFTTGVVVAETSMSEQNVLKGREAFGGWHKARPGVRRLLRLLKPEDQPPIGKSTSTWAESVKRSKRAKPLAPKGFAVDLVASGPAGPRVIRVAPNG